MTKQEIKEVLYRILIEKIGLFYNDLSEEKTLEDLGMDSLDTIELVCFLEERFHIEEIDHNLVMTTHSVAAIIDTIHHLLLSKVNKS